MKVLATYSIKGGVGKTTAAVNLAYVASTMGARVLLWDLDPQGAATFSLRIKARVKGGAARLASKRGELESHIRASDESGLHLVPADFSLRHLDLHLDDTAQPTRRLRELLDPLDEAYDIAILDCAPGITLTSESVFAASDALLVPTIPTTLSRRTLDQLAEFLRELPDRPLMLPFASMVDRRKRLHRDVVRELTETVPGFLPTAIPSASVIEQMGVARAPVGVFAPATPAAESFRSLWADVATRLWS
ncbi:MAG: ParA family protein [Ilumatobacteraceae bacterium]